MRRVAKPGGHQLIESRFPAYLADDEADYFEGLQRPANLRPPSCPRTVAGSVEAPRRDREGL